VDTPSYPDITPWYQSVLPFGSLGGFYNTAADAVYRGFDWKKVYSLGASFREAAARLERRKDVVRRLTEKHGFKAENGNTYICPLMLETLLDVLPDEPVPPRHPENGGAPEIPFDAFLKAWVLAPFYEVEDNSAALWRALARNTDFMVRCGFPGNVLPDVRSFQRFNEVMTFGGLWAEARRMMVLDNLANGVLPSPKRLAIDPGHEDGYAGVHKACAACRACKACDPADRVFTCDVTDIVAKRKTYQFPGVKGVFVADADEDVPLLAVGVNARTFDGNTGIETAKAFAKEYPEQVDTVEEALLDGAFDIKDEKKGISEALGGADVLTPINPRRRKDQPVEGHRGIDHINPYGLPICVQGLGMVYLGRDMKREDFLYGCPLLDRNTGKLDCPNQGRCCPNPGSAGRTFRVPRERTPQVDWENPQHSQDFKDRYDGRTSSERVIGRTKRSFPFERHWGRGHAAFQAHLDKGVLAFHVLLSTAHALGVPEKGRSPLTFHEKAKAA
jgi:hypothetical protein